MHIQWTTYTWYSRLGALIFFLLILPMVCVYIGIQYEKTLTALSLEEDLSKVIMEKPQENVIHTEELSDSFLKTVSTASLEQLLRKEQGTLKDVAFARALQVEYARRDLRDKHIDALEEKVQVVFKFCWVSPVPECGE